MPKKIKGNVFEDLREALHDAAAYERGETINLRVTTVPARPRQISAREIRRIRLALNASQTLFATYLNVSPNAVCSWEQGLRRPQTSRPQTPHHRQEKPPSPPRRLAQPSLAALSLGVNVAPPFSPATPL